MELQVQKREKFGKAAKHLIKEGFIPSELYGHGVENVHLSVPTREFRKVFKEAGESSIVSLVLDGKTIPVLVHDISTDAISGEFTHIDFYQVRMNEKIAVNVPIIFIGESPAVKDQSGVLIKAMTEVEVEALPTNLPHDIKVDLGILDELDKSIYVKDLSVPANVEILTSPDMVIASVNAPMTEEEEQALSEAAAKGIEGIKVETEEKVSERAAQKAEEEK